jgi:hypothetical protein
MRKGESYTGLTEILDKSMLPGGWSIMGKGTSD